MKHHVWNTVVTLQVGSDLSVDDVHNVAVGGARVFAADPNYTTASPMIQGLATTSRPAGRWPIHPCRCARPSTAIVAGTLIPAA